MDGYIRESSVKAGHTVARDAVVCRLDERDLLLERQGWLSKKNQYERQHQEAIAKHSLAEASIVNAQLEQAQAQLALVENRLALSTIRAPFSGIVIKGDLSQRLGGAVLQGGGDLPDRAPGLLPADPQGRRARHHRRCRGADGRSGPLLHGRRPL